MRILLISSNSSGAGGGEQYLIYLSKGLKDLGEEPIVLLSSVSYMDIWENKFRDIGVKVLRRNLIGLRDRPLRIFQSLLDRKQIELIAQICRQVKPDIIHVNQQYDADGLDYLMGAIKFGKERVFGTIHMPMTQTKHPRSIYSPRAWIIRALALDKIKKVILKNWYNKYRYEKIFPSLAMKEEFCDIFGQTSSSHAILPGLLSREVNYSLRNQSNRKIIGFCGRLVPQKDPLLFIGSWLKAIELGLKDSKLLIIGDGFLRKEIENVLSRRAPIDSWEITGWVNNPQEYLSKIDLLVFTSLFEGLPLALIEAAGMGKSCICLDFPGVKELENKIPWLTVIKSRLSEDISRLMIQTLTNNVSPTEEEISGVKSYFSTRRMAIETVNLYKGKTNE